MDRTEWIANAVMWRSEHFNHVWRLEKDGDAAVEPSGSDVLHPELWKGIHWRWLYGQATQHISHEGDKND